MIFYIYLNAMNVLPSLVYPIIPILPKGKAEIQKSYTANLWLRQGLNPRSLPPDPTWLLMPPLI